ncbi:MAG TPA: hypothetical protein VL551_27925 [Actinospica sp.]|jgi:hypothetical protein|nr:hypothetical protein [Actinospica sp.]
MAEALYVEARIRAGMDELWAATQVPGEHQRWDLRFTHIDYLPQADGEPQRFRYGVRVAGVMLCGTGTCAGESRRADGMRTSALRFASGHPLSLLAAGSGYWRYVPTGDGVRFLTGYDYRPRWGWFGRFADPFVFRPLMGWATAWSFDRLRLWLERGIPPERSRWHAVLEVVLRGAFTLAAAVMAPHAVVVLCVAAVVAIGLPPMPTTPAARRCLRRRPDTDTDRISTAPAILDRLEAPTCS